MIDRRLLLALVGCAACVAIIAAELQADSSGVVGKAAVRSFASPDKAIAKIRQIPAQQLVAVARARPLFSPTRRPPEKGKTAGFDLGDKRLAGIVITPERRLAIFAVNGGKPLVVDEGDAVNGWKIEKITSNAISLRGSGGTETLQPKLDQSLIAHSPALTSPVGRKRSPPDAARGSSPPVARAEPGQGRRRPGHDQ